MIKKTSQMIALIAVLSIISFNSCNSNNNPDPPQETQWSKTYGYKHAESAQSIDQTTDNGFVVAGYTFSKGYGNNDIWIFKLDSSGNMLWDRTYGVSDGNNPDYGYTVKATPDGGCILAGEARLYDIGDEDWFLTTPSYKFNMYIAKISPDGYREWKKRYGGTDYDRANSITTTKDGGYIVAGHTQSFAEAYPSPATPPAHNKKDAWIIKMDSNGDKLWEVIHGGAEGDGINSIYETEDGGYIAAGFTASQGAGSYDFWVLKLGSAGIIEWEKTYGGEKADTANSIVQTSDGGYIVAGETWSFGAGQTDFYVVKLAADGAEEWSNTYGGAKFERARSICQTADGEYLVAGYTSSYGAGNKDFWIIRINSTGELQSWQTQGGTSCDEANSIRLTNDGGYVVAGNTSSQGAGDIDAWVIKFDKIK